jgi:hypothetical protein
VVHSQMNSAKINVRAVSLCAKLTMDERIDKGQLVTFSPCQTCLSDDFLRKVAKFRRIRHDREWLLGQELAFLAG